MMLGMCLHERKFAVVKDRCFQNLGVREDFWCGDLGFSLLVGVAFQSAGK